MAPLPGPGLRKDDTPWRGFGGSKAGQGRPGAAGGRLERVFHRRRVDAAGGFSRAESSSEGHEKDGSRVYGAGGFGQAGRSRRRARRKT